MAIFENPNFPLQPQKGVYGWYAQKDGQATIVIYIGMAGQKPSLIPKGTLFRGISELQRNTFTSNTSNSPYNTLDTDFIVGTAILYFERNGYSCVWSHISDNPADELRYVAEQKPILQNVSNTKIKMEFKLRKDEKDYWKTRKTQDGVKEAERELFSLLDKTVAKK